MRSVNKLTLIGNLGKDPEIKNGENYTMCTFSLATTERYKDEEVTQWHNIVVFGKLSEVCEKYLNSCPLYIKHIAVGDPAEEILKVIDQEKDDVGRLGRQ